MKKSLTFIFIILITPVIAAVYGMLHDQLTYTISPEYYTKFKFFQFGLKDGGDEAIFPNPRLYVAIVGALATWWVGVPLGIILACVGFIHRDHNKMLRACMGGILVTLAVAIVTGLIGLAYGWWWGSNGDVDWWFPKTLIDKKAFVTVGYMHNFSYLGGLIGLVAGAIYIILKRRSRA